MSILIHTDIDGTPTKGKTLRKTIRQPATTNNRADTIKRYRRVERRHKAVMQHAGRIYHDTEREAYRRVLHDLHMEGLI